ncbi:MAG: hydantoinase/oxoprolinase N-terminal domain-containing protein [Eubacteriales bacterium]|jgi:N-methylhydantoinase A/oxoprolinase/acetone carboxylase beta subunit
MNADYILGIDTGGTYTDAVIYKSEKSGGGLVVASAKSLTTKDDLCIGIVGAVSALDPELLKLVGRVALSTTLATNACVEGRGSRCGLIIVGGDRGIVEQRAAEFGLLAASDICFLDGRIDLDGNEAEPFDVHAREKIAKLIELVPCVAVSGMLSNRNPAHEYKARDIVAELGGSSVCSVDVAPGELNYLRRASTALLNARLLPVIREFLFAVTHSLARLGVSAPVSVVRSDGTLMSAEFAALRPVETLLSGPTASVVGALNLVGGSTLDAVIADIGGTTTDIALVEGGEPVKTGLGIDIGNWRTSVSSTYIETYGLGGDSRVIIDRDGKLALCDERVVPLCNLSARCPDVRESLRRLAESPYQGLSRRYELLELLKMPPEGALSGREKKICEQLSSGPMAVAEISERVGFEVLPTDLRTLETRGYIIRAGFTPTDAMHILGIFDKFDAQASLLGARYFERHLRLCARELAEAVLDIASFKFYTGIVRILARRHIGGAGEDFPPQQLLEAAWSRGDEALFRPVFSSAATLVAVGAPAKAIASRAAEKLGMRLVVPEFAGVANAVGAAVCTVKCERSVFIRPSSDEAGQGGYIVMGGGENVMFDSYEDALAEAQRRAAELAARDARHRGVTGELEITVSEEKHDSHAMTDMGEVTVELGATVTAVARAASV